MRLYQYIDSLSADIMMHKEELSPHARSSLEPPASQTCKGCNLKQSNHGKLWLPKQGKRR